MNTEDNIHTQGAREKLMRGIIKAREVIASTYGPQASTVITQETLYPGYAVVDDGAYALDKIKLDDPIEQMGVEILKESVKKSNKESGDGSTTSTILTAAILQAGIDLKVEGREVKESLDACLPFIEKSLDEQTKQISVEEVGPIASIASGDSSIGVLLEDIYTNIGKDGVVELDHSGTPVTSYEIVSGVRFRGVGFLHEMMTNDGKGKTATLQNPKFLIVKQPITSTNQIDGILKGLISSGVMELVIFYKEISDQVLQYMAEGHVSGRFKFLLLKAPTLWQDWLFEDIAIVTGGRIIDQQTGTSLAMMGSKVNWLGSAEKIVAHKDETLIFPHPENVSAQSAFATHLENLKEEGKKDDQQLVRASWLETKTAVLKIGANSDSELKLKFLKIEDGRNSCYQALQSGIVEGAGKALYTAANACNDSLGGKILKTALCAPYLQLQENMGVEEIDTTNIYDPAAIPKNALRNAVSVAGTVLTAKSVITIPPKE